MALLKTADSPWRFLGSHVRRHYRLAAVTLASVVSGASCAVAAQYCLKLLIDRMSSSASGSPLLPLAIDVGLFLGMLAAESSFWRLAGWLGSRLVIRIDCDIRL